MEPNSDELDFNSPLFTLHSSLLLTLGITHAGLLPTLGLHRFEPVAGDDRSSPGQFDNYPTRNFATLGPS